MRCTTPRCVRGAPTRRCSTARTTLRVPMAPRACSGFSFIRLCCSARYAPLRTVSDYLNRELPDARIGFLILNGASPSGYLGSSHSANWHDWSTYHALVNAAVAEDVAAVVRRHGLTHVVVATAQSDS